MVSKRICEDIGSIQLIYTTLQQKKENQRVNLGSTEKIIVCKGIFILTNNTKISQWRMAVSTNW